MQQIPATYHPFSFQSALQHKESLVEDVPSVRYNGSSVNSLKKQSISPEDHSFKKRLQIFKQYKPKFNTVSENDDTVVYKIRRRAADSEESKYPKQPALQRQFSYGKELNRYGSGDDLAEQSFKRRQKIFGTLKPISTPKYQLSFKSMKERQEEQLITTQRFRKNIDAIIPSAQESDPKGFSLFSAKTENPSSNNLNIVYSRTPSLQKLGSDGQLKLNVAPLNQIVQQIKPNVLISPKKITFTYQNSSSFTGITQLPVPIISNPNLFASQTLALKAVNKVQSPSLPRSFVERHSTAFKDTGLSNHERSNNQKRTYDFGDRSWNNKTRTAQTNKLSSWGNKIRTELMGRKHQVQEKSLKQRDFGSSKISLNLVKESLIINGQKIVRQNLKINESLSNISDDQNSKRYFDQEIDFLPQVKKISYNNIDISREDSVPQNHEQFKPNQLLLEFQTQKYQPTKNEEILQILDVSPVYKPVSKKNQEPQVEKNILQELSQQIKSEQLVKQVNKTGKLFPVILVLFATMLFIIQAVV